MAQETFKQEIISDSEITVIGSGEIGDKANQLIDKTPLLKSLDWRVPKRTVLAEGFFGNLKIASQSLSEEQIKTLEDIRLSYSKQPMVIRSSAAGDARGTGTYKSVFSENKADSVQKGIQEVLTSYFSADAAAFRRDAHTGEGFGVIIEPVVGQEIDGYLTPVLSGFGYTSNSRGKGFVTIVPGLGCAVESRVGERISKSQLEKYNGSLSHYIYEKQEEMYSQRQSWKRSAILRTDHQSHDRSYSAQVYYHGTSYHEAGIINTSIDYPEEIDQVLSGSLNFSRLFSAMEKIESKLNKPQYLEWAMTLESGKPVFWLIQIADASKKLDLMEFGNFGKIMFIGHTVTGAGIKDCIKIANCWNPDDIPRLNQFNQHNQNYVLIFSSRLTSAALGLNRKLSYSDFSNAGVFLEIQDALHVRGDPVAHLGGQLDMTGKLFGVLDYDAEVPPEWDLFHKNEILEDGLRVFDGKIKVVASERQNHLVVYLRN